MAKGGKYYVVWVGVEPGVYDSWEEAQEQVANYPGAKYKSFRYQDEAIAAYRNQSDENLDILVSLAEREKPRIVDYSAFPEIDLTAMAVDASCLGNPGRMEYQGVDVATGEKIFRIGPFDDATNNIGEYLALVHALAMTHKQGIARTIYSDSRTAMAWVRNRRANTKLAPTARNAKVIELIRRADLWLQTHTWNNRIIKWETEIWGEIPADFGRK
jgi:ribonuclease HI